MALSAIALSLGCGGTHAPSDAEADAGSSPTPDATEERPAPPAELEHWLTGNVEDADVQPSGPALFLAGGGRDQDAGFAWAQSLAPGGDVVILRTSGADGYNDYLFSDIGGFDSIETLMLDNRDLADSPYASWAIRHAELIFMAGGDQWTYIDNWRNTNVQEALGAAWERGAIIGGTSAGCAVLGEFAFSAENDTVYSSEALEDPYNEYMTLERDVLSVPLLEGIITDTHFAARDRMGRLAGFLARILTDGEHPSPVGLGIDEATALLITSVGSGEVIGEGSVYVLAPTAVPANCTNGEPLTFEGIPYLELQAGDTMQLSNPLGSRATSTLSIVNGVMTPLDPY